MPSQRSGDNALHMLHVLSTYVGMSAAVVDAIGNAARGRAVLIVIRGSPVKACKYLDENTLCCDNQRCVLPGARQ